MSDPVAMLMECHERIRRFSAGLERLCLLEDLSDHRAIPTARACHRYFSLGLPLHARDEDESLVPRLLDLRLSRVQRQALADIEIEHLAIERALPELLSALDGPLERHALRGIGLPMVGLLRGHIDAEELLVFPLVQRLSPGDRADMVDEIRARHRHGSVPAGRSAWSLLRRAACGTSRPSSSPVASSPSKRFRC